MHPFSEEAPCLNRSNSMEKTAHSCWRRVWRWQFDSSWEEKVFAEDASGLLGGCIWPPRTYSRGFCTRHFRSAQALGGRMNVPRRDRALLLKQSLSTSNGDTVTLNEIIPSSVSPFRVSADLSSRENFADHNLSREDMKSRVSWEDYLGFAVEKSRKEEDQSFFFCHDEEKIVVSDSFQFGQSRSSGPCGNEAISCKRLKMADDNLIQRYDQVISCLNTNCNSAEDLDLELRLGDPPANFK